MWLNTRFPPATVSTGNYVVVDLPPAVAEHFPHGAYFVKQVVGVPGDVVVATGRDYVVIHDHTPVHVGRAKLMSRKGDALQAGPVGVIPPGYYFIRGTHPDSLDSRYAMMGWVPESSIIGAAVPILPAFTADWFVHWGWCQR
jgi:type IV secretory pathway protease TraF